MFHKILVAIDNSEIGQHVFDKAVSLVKAIDGSLLLLHVLSPFDGGSLSPLFVRSNGVYPSLRTETVDNYMKVWEELQQERLDLLRSFGEKAINAGVTTELTQNVGDPGRVICEVARSWQADLIVVGRRGRTGLSEFFLGSVSNYVLHHAPCSVLTIQRPIHATTQAQEAVPASESADAVKIPQIPPVSDH